ncbi:hypothetical protein Bca4012_064196 [Brassica carinata]
MAKMINKTLLLTYTYLLIYILLSSGVILYNKVLSLLGSISQILQLSPSYNIDYDPHGVFWVCRLPSHSSFQVPVATFIMAVVCGTDKARCDVFMNMLLVSVGVVVSSYGEINFNIIGTVYQVTGIFAEALRLVLTQVLLQKKGLTLNPVTSLYYIAPCSFVFLSLPWYVLEKPNIEVSQIQFNFWIFFSNALCALALNFSIFLVIGRTGAVTIRVAGVLKDWILIALSTVIFPESTITGLNIIGYAIALVGVVMYNYIKIKDVKATQPITDSLPDRITKDWKAKSSSDGESPRGIELIDEEAPLITSRLSHIGRTQTQLGTHTAV